MTASRTRWAARLVDGRPSRWDRLLLAALVGVLVSVSTGYAAQPASAATTTRQNCAVVLGKAPSAQSESPVVAATCAAGTPLAPAGSTLLATLYQHGNYGGASTSIYGDSGPCDSAGYRVPDLQYANFIVGGISSYRVYSNCNYSKICNGLPGSDYSCSAYRCWDVSYVGDLYNDRVLQMWLRNYLYCV